MATVSLVLSALFGVLAVGVRTALHVRRTGRTPIRSGSGVAWIGAIAGLSAAFVAGPLAELVFGVHRWTHSAALAAAGIALSVLGLIGVVWSQAAMGESLRIGVDPSERTALVTRGPFRFVRNPIYSAMLVYVTGVALLVPNAASVVALVLLVIAIDLHVRRVEEPYLLATHGPEYAGYCERVGRFVPGVGRRVARRARGGARSAPAPPR
jgi:protein-S-isoprenylcysteine O-methyltransferase Ste14